MHDEVILLIFFSQSVTVYSIHFKCNSIFFLYLTCNIPLIILSLSMFRNCNIVLFILDTI